MLTASTLRLTCGRDGGGGAFTLPCPAQTDNSRTTMYSNGHAQAIRYAHLSASSLSPVLVHPPPLPTA